ncbi:MAG: LysM peptidoglycan-binding domain-containing protein [Lachnospiraceae bacterium]|nr:LysM peptidoglycan-binding domain-containing protein [Lachnospiraceae bacterium]
MAERRRKASSSRKKTESVKAPNTDVERRKRRKRKKAREQMLMKAGFAAVVVIIILVLVFVFTRKNGVDIIVNGQSVASVADKKVDTEYIVKTVEAQLASEYGTQVQIQDEVEAVKTRIDKDKAVSSEYAISVVRNMVTYNVLGGVIYVNGTQVLAMDNIDSLNALLEEIKAQYVPEGSKIISASFVDDVKTEAAYVPEGTIIDRDTALAKLTKGVPTQKSYSVKSGDSFYLIATVNGITVEELLEANPGLTINTPIKVGDKLNLVVSVPFLSVKTVEQTTYTAKQDKTVEYKTNSSKDSSYKRVIQQGRDGQKEVTVEIIRINGFEEEQKTISEVTIVEPVTEVIEIGKR